MLKDSSIFPLNEPIHMPSVLGQLVGKDRIRLCPSKASAVRRMTEPTDIHELRRFLGMVINQGSTSRGWLSSPTCLEDFSAKRMPGFGVLIISTPSTSLKRNWALPQPSRSRDYFVSWRIVVWLGCSDDPETERWKLETSGLYISRAYCHRKAIRPDWKKILLPLPGLVRDWQITLSESDST